MIVNKILYIVWAYVFKYSKYKLEFTKQTTRPSNIVYASIRKAYICLFLFKSFESEKETIFFCMHLTNFVDFCCYCFYTKYDKHQLNNQAFIIVF
jgi:hypothetical protein